ncbi:sensor histidine kinase [Paenibacillus solanacearum]|uniref:sensor histidine kinase n=1 Tax=Paenibacillus solanacearum TaxID=2048548 RepID=UPI001C40761F|nr:sensor histidine kinase [Paenibacillus solanacearum]
MRLKNKESPLILWTTLILICSGLAGLQVILERVAIPYLYRSASPSVVDTATLCAGILNFAISTFPYYAILVVFLRFNGLFLYNKWMHVLLSLPIWLTLFFYTDLWGNRVQNWFVAVWGAGYMLAAIGLVLRSVLTEKNPERRLHHSMIGLIFIVPVAIVNAYQFAPGSNSELWLRIIPIICFVSMASVILLYVRGSFLGVKRRSIQSIHIGTSLIQHSLKNTIGKIKLNALNIQKSLDKQQYTDIERYADQLLKTYDEMMGTMARISQAVNDTAVVQMKEHNVSDIVEEVVRSLSVYPGIRVEKHYDALPLMVDRAVFTDCLHNIVNNAVEAMKEAGTIRIALECRKKTAMLSISDTGPGMDPLQLQNVFEPFHSTKYRSGKHFGLGMYQVKKAMDAHKGKIEIRSRLQHGTTVRLILKRSREGGHDGKAEGAVR